jgi:hypothetical protein
MPEHARGLVNRICSVPEEGASPLELIDELLRTANRPSRLTRLRRAGPAAVLTAPYLFVFAAMLLSLYVPVVLSPPGAPWMEDLINAPLYRETLRNIPNENVESNEQTAEALRKVLANSYTQAQSTPEGRQVVSAFSADVRRELEAAAQRYPQLSETDVVEARQALPPMPSLATRLRQGMPGMIGQTWLVSAFVALLMAAILGTGPLFRIFQMSLQTRDGRKAGRLRCLIRAIVAWPPIPPFAMSVVAPMLGIPRVQPTPELLLWLIAIAVAGLIYNLITPERGIPDIIAGTFLVPE